MAPISLTFDIPANIQAGLEAEKYIRNGGVIQDTSGRVVMWLRETNLDKVMSSGISSPLLSAGAVSSILTLGVSVIGFGVIYRKLQNLESRLQKAQKFLEKIDKKVDISFYANFRAALDLANNAFSMKQGANRHSSAHAAINRFLEAEHTYTELLSDVELSTDSQIGNEYLLTLCLAYLAEIRCYLELEELDVALERLSVAQYQVRSLVEKYIDLLVISNPLIFLHPDLKEKISLSRLTKIYQWKDTNFNESLVFDELRMNFDVKGNHSKLQFDIIRWVKQIPFCFLSQSDLEQGITSLRKKPRQDIIHNLLPQVLEDLESMIEMERRLLAYQSEIKAIQKLGLNFQKWDKLHTFKENKDNKDMIYIVAKEPMLLEAQT